MPEAPDELVSKPESGCYITGLFLEGARWDTEEETIVDSRAKELYPSVPVMHVYGLTVDEMEAAAKGRYECPVFTTSIRGPTFVFAAPLRTVHRRPNHWVLAAVALLMQSD